MTDENTETALVPAEEPLEPQTAPQEQEEAPLSDNDKEDFEKDVQTYKTLAEKAKREFLKNMLDLGCILAGFQDKWKPKKVWVTFLKETKINYGTSNILIRLYHYSVLHPEVIEACDLDGWVKIQQFVKLSDDSKEDLAQKIAGDTVSTKEFVALVEGIVQETPELPEATPEIAEAEMPDAGHTLESENVTDQKEFEKIAVSKSLQENPMLESRFLAERMVQNLASAGYSAPQEAIPVAESYVLVTKASNRLKEADFSTLDETSRREWLGIVKDSISELQTLVTSLE